jgi:hypothetical protein
MKDSFSVPFLPIVLVALLLVGVGFALNRKGKS